MMQLSDLWDGYSHPWLLATLIAVLAAAVAVVLQGAIYAILRRVTRFSTVASAVVELTALPARYVLPLLALQFVLAAAPEAVRVQPGIESTLAVLLTAAITWFAVRAVAGVAEAVVRLNPANVADNLHARRVQTQTRVLARTVMFFIVLIGAASALMTFPGMRQIGTSLLASAGVAGLVAGIAARPVLGNLIAGLQIALTQPIRLDDVVIMENEWGRIEEITSTYVVVKIWDERRLVVPLQYVIEHPFQNWTRTGSELLGTVYLWLDYRVPIAPLRAELQRVCESAPEWDKRVAMIQVTDADQHAIQIRVLVSTQDASKGWDLRCRVREALIDFVQREYPEALPRLRAEMDRAERHPPSTQPAPPPQRAGKGDSTAIKHPTNPEVNAAHDERAPAEAQSTR
jgi:small-conductance mechanosensitive channel